MPGIIELPSKAVVASSPSEFIDALESTFQATRGLSLPRDFPSSSETSIPAVLEQLCQSLQSSSPADAEAIKLALEKITDSPQHGGLGIDATKKPTSDDYEDTLFLVSAYLTALNNSQQTFQATIPERKAATQPMTLTQKIFAAHSLSPLPETGLHTGAVIRAGLDWVLASELSWSAMARTHESLGNPGIWRNDRFWLAGDHVVHPDVRGVAKVERMVDLAEKAKKMFRMTDFQGMNYTIMHTEFVRERAEPGMLCVGSDSHTCSGGAIGCLSIGLGAADVMMALALGQTWFKIPETIRIDFTGKPSRGVSGKDVILHILRELKRNTVAAERIVEFTGEGCQYLSIDARFAICNMCTEFGAVTGLFVPDEVTKSYVSRRRRKANKQNSVYFKPDEGAQYASEHTIDLSKVEPTIAVYPEPDHVVPVSEKAGMKIDGVFIGACTTTEEELVLAGMLLKVGLAKKLPLVKGKRHYVPGSLPIVERLNELGLLKVYEEAGFTRGPPGCSYCVGMSAEKAEKGETWLSSQNRNFQNRMGPGKLSFSGLPRSCAL
jgi:homoaconitase/3-isopropylmalate dehydratase large subunit